MKKGNITHILLIFYPSNNFVALESPYMLSRTYFVQIIIYCLSLNLFPFPKLQLSQTVVKYPNLKGKLKYINTIFFLPETLTDLTALFIPNHENLNYIKYTGRHHEILMGIRPILFGNCVRGKTSSIRVN